MKVAAVLVRTLPPLACAFAVGCTQVPSGSGTSAVQGAGSGEPGTGGGGDRLYYRSTLDWEPYTDPVSQGTSMVQTRNFYVLDLHDNGYAYVGGDYDAIDATVCDQPKKDKNGHDLCVAYQIDGGTLRLGDQAHAFTDSDGAATIDGVGWTRAAPTQLVAGHYLMTGYYGVENRQPAVVAGSELSIGDDGTFTASWGRYSVAVFGSAVASCSAPCTVSGNYTVGAHSITVTTQGHEPKSYFLLTIPNHVQIGASWFVPN